MLRLLILAAALAGSSAAIANCSLLPSLPESTPDSRFLRSEPVAGQPVVEDLHTGLVWQGCEAGFSGSDCEFGAADTFDWSAALQHAEGSLWAGLSGWRLPNARELQSLVETACTAPAINTTLFPVDIGADVWSSTGAAQIENSKREKAWRVSFADGTRMTALKLDTMRVRLVRGGHGLDEFDAGADFVPDPIADQLLRGRPLNAIVEFGPLPVSGISTPVGVAVSGPGTAYSVNGGAFVATPGAVRAGDLVRVRHTSGPTPGAEVDSLLRVGPLQVALRSVTASDNAALAALAVDSGSLAPAFAPDTLSYAVAVPNAVTAIRVTAQTADSGASVEVAGMAAVSGVASGPLPLAPGSNAIDVDVLAEDGMAARRYTLSVDRALAASVTSLVSDAGSVLPGSLVTFTATVVGDAPSGSVRFLAAGNTLPGCLARPLSGGPARTATCTAASLPAGEIQVRAEYSGDAANLPSADQITQTVNTPPAIAVADSALVNEDATVAIAFTVSDAESAAASLELDVEASPASLFDVDALRAGLGGSGGARSLQLSPRANAFGDGVVTLIVEDPQRGRSEAAIAVQVLPVNDPPSVSLPARLAHPAGAVGPRQVVDFASAISPGPANESGQSVDFEVSVLDDPRGVLVSLDLDPSGRLDYVLSGNSGAARVQLTPVDDGGSERGGIDRGVPSILRVFVGPGSDIEALIERVLPVDDDLARAVQGGASAGEFLIRVRNHGPDPLAQLDLQALGLRGITGLLWQCEPPVACSPVGGSGIVRTQAALAVDAELRMTVSGVFRPEQFYLVLKALPRAPGGGLMRSSGISRILVEPLHPTAIFHSPFE